MFTDFRTKLYSFHNFSLRFILKIFSKFRNFSLNILTKYILIKKKECTKVEATGASNNRMFPNTPEVSQMVCCLCTLKACLVILSCPKNYLLFGCLRRTLVVTKVLGGFLVSSESVSYRYGSGRNFEGMFCLYTEIFRRPS